MKLHNLKIVDKEGSFQFLLDDKQINGILSYEIRGSHKEPVTVLKLELDVGDIEYCTKTEKKEDKKSCKTCRHYAGEQNCGDILCAKRCLTSDLIWSNGCPDYEARRK